MSQPLMSVVRTADSPDQAKMFVALLQAEGIPAHIDGDGLADEFMTSRRLMNLAGVKVLVPTSSLVRARDLLAPVEIDEAELERQALEAEDPEAPPPR
jgi:predicted methyltransferase MtxX (methanogen marker protein 4)